MKKIRVQCDAVRMFCALTSWSYSLKCRIVPELAPHVPRALRTRTGMSRSEVFVGATSLAETMQIIREQIKLISLKSTRH